MDVWHYERAKLQKVTPIQGDYTYHFLDCGHKLRVERAGQKISLIEFNYFGIHTVPEPEPVHESVPESVPEPLPTFNMSGLSSSALYEGIEEAHWEQLRIRHTNDSWFTDPSYIKSMEWVDEAWYEIQSRREEEAPVLLAEEPDVFESHY